jgi:hypothetical protein
MSVPAEFICPISGHIMWDAVVEPSGRSCSERAWKSMDSPQLMTYPNNYLRERVREWCLRHPRIPGVSRKYDVYRVVLGTPYAYTHYCTVWRPLCSELPKSWIPLRVPVTLDPLRPDMGIEVMKRVDDTCAFLEVPAGGTSISRVIMMRDKDGTLRNLGFSRDSEGAIATHYVIQSLRTHGWQFMWQGADGKTIRPEEFKEKPGSYHVAIMEPVYGGDTTKKNKRARGTS